MAKGKHSTALFEVIAKGKMPARADASSVTPGGTATHSNMGSLATPKWWFKSRTRNEMKTMSPGQTVATPVAPTPAPAPVPAAPVARVEPPVRAPEPKPAPLPLAAPVVAAAPGVESGGDTVERVQPVKVSVDPDRQQINLRLSYTSALIGGFGLVVVIGVAVLIGKTLSRGPSPAIAGPSTPLLRQGPANPNVLNVGRRTDGGTSTGTVAGNRPAGGGGGAPAAGGNAGGARAPQPRNASEPSPPTTFFTDDAKRQSGLNYVIIQSYPDRDTADKAAEFLTKHGIPCTVEKGLPAWPLPWAEGCAVVGIRGFARIGNNAEADGYVASINQASAKFAANRGFKAFQPQFYKWRQGK